jgi:hypothetical protein
MHALASLLLLAATAPAADWTAPVEVTHDDQRCLAYRAKWTGEYLVLDARLEPGWHTFAIDNKQRQVEKLAGKPSLGLEKPTEINVADGLELAGPWFQTSPKDFSKPELRWYSWGFEQHATFAAKARRTATGPARITVRGQACTESVCKNIEVSLTVPVPETQTPDPAPDFKSLVQVR